VAALLCGVLIGALGVRFGASHLPAPTQALSDPERIERPCAPISAETAVIVVYGQSNAGNFGTRRASAHAAVDNFDPATGKCFAATDPLLGADGTGGHFGTLLGDILIDAGRYRRVVIATSAVSGATVEELNTKHAWRIDDLVAKLKAAGLKPTHVLYEQGEADARRPTSTALYVTTLHALVQRIRAAGVDAPFYLSQTTTCGYDKADNIAAIRAAQLAALDDKLDIRRGPDTDAIGYEGRNLLDGCHMSAVGTLANAALWAAFIDAPKPR
jgi:hypothetical protein